MRKKKLLPVLLSLTLLFTLVLTSGCRGLDNAADPVIKMVTKKIEALLKLNRFVSTSTESSNGKTPSDLLDEMVKQLAEQGIEQSLKPAAQCIEKHLRRTRNPVEPKTSRADSWVWCGRNGTVGKGPVLDSKPHGSWVIRARDGTVGKGLFVHGKPHGRWVARLADGTTEEMSFVCGKRQ